MQLVHMENLTQAGEVQQMVQQAEGAKCPLKNEELVAGWRQAQKQEQNGAVPIQEEGEQ